MGTAGVELAIAGGAVITMVSAAQSHDKQKVVGIDDLEEMIGL